MNKIITIFKIPELAQKIGITLLFLAIYRIGYYIPLPVLDQQRFAEVMRGAATGAFGQFLGFVSSFRGGALGRSTIFVWDVMPYFSASIISQLLARLPNATQTLLFDATTGNLKESIYTLGGGGGQDVSFEKLIVLVVLFIGVVVAVVAITMGQRRIPTQSAKHVRGRRVFGGTRQFLPLRVNQAGVMPVIFASSLLMIPMFLLNIMQGTQWRWARSLKDAFERQGYVYNLF